MSMNTEPGVCSFAGGAYVTIWSPRQEPVTIDGIHAVPGAGLEETERGQAKTAVQLDYGGGMTTIVGPGSVAVPGALAAFEKAWKRYGSVSWETLFQPTIDVTRAGFPLSESCHYYLGYCGELIYGRSQDGYKALHDQNGHVRDAGSLIVVPGLADSLEAIARGGARVFYEGELADAMTEHVRDGGGTLTKTDLSNYRAIERRSLTAKLDSWCIATNPPPAVGGAMLAAMLLACRKLQSNRWDSDSLKTLIEVQQICLDFRRKRLDLAEDIDAAVVELIEAAKSDRLPASHSSSTVHTSAVDDSGLACSITASAGYGSGEMPEGTGLWLNNGLGEVELNRLDVDSRAPGARLPSNMAPSIARGDGTVLSIGSPGADRITTAILQVLINALQLGMPLVEAIAHPRLHVDTSGDGGRLMAEPGLDLPTTALPLTVFDRLNMYFGGVGAALFERQRGFEVAADPRRESGCFVS